VQYDLSDNFPESCLGWADLEACIRRDPAGRGVSACTLDGRPLLAGQLMPAAESLAQGRWVGIVTGFCVFDGSRWTAETDGPPGALVLARALLELEFDVTLLSDPLGAPLLEAGCDLWGLPRSIVEVIPFEDGGPESPARQSNEPQHCQKTDAWVESFLHGRGRAMTHLVSIERVGPSHTRESLTAQRRCGPAPREAFDEQVPPASRNVCHNMRGVPVDAHTAKTHRLFEAVAGGSGTSADAGSGAGMAAASADGMVTIGVGDGGNEIGMGQVPWEVLSRAIATGPAGRVACRVATTYTLAAGVSNWGGYALAAAVCALRGRRELVRRWPADDQRRLIETLVREAGAVDGLTRRAAPTVDGLDLDAYLETYRQIMAIA
jgi:hypothetical protein